MNYNNTYILTFIRRPLSESTYILTFIRLPLSESIHNLLIWMELDGVFMILDGLGWYFHDSE